MKGLDRHIGWGILLVGAGALLLLQSFELLLIRDAIVWAVVFGIASVALWLVLARGQTKAWLTFLGYFAAVSATLIALDETHIRIFGRLAGQILAGGIGLGFVALYLAERKRRWAFLTGGGFLALAAATAVDDLLVGVGDLATGVFFAGLGAALGLFYYLEGLHERRHSWALYSAAVLIFIGLLVAASEAMILNAVWALVLIGSGGYLIWRSRASKNGQQENSGAEAR